MSVCRVKLLLSISILLLSIFVFFLRPLEAVATNPILRLDETNSDPDLTIGAHIRLEIIVNDTSLGGAAPWTIEFPSPRRWLMHGPLLVDAYSIGEGNDRIEKIRIDGVVLDEGEVVIPPFFIRQEGEIDTIETNSLEIQTKSNFKSKEEKKKSKPAWLLNPLMQGGFNSMVLGVIAVIIVSLVAYLIYLLVHYLKTKYTAKKPTPKLLADQDVLSLKAFIHQSSEKSEFSKEFSFQVTEVMRRYLAKRLELPLLKATDRELLAKLSRETVLSRRALDRNQITKCATILDATFAQRYYVGDAINRDSAAQIVSALSEIITEVEQSFTEQTTKIKKGANT